MQSLGELWTSESIHSLTPLLQCCVSCFFVAEDVKMAYMGEVGSEEFLMKLTTQITEMVSAKMTQGEERLVLQKKQLQKCI